MAIIKLDEGPGLGQLLGTGLGSGVGTGLQRLAQMKINEFAQRQQQQQTTSGLQALGLSPQEASQVSLLPPALQSEVVKNYLRGAESAGLDQMLGSLGMGGGAAPQQQAVQQGISGQQLGAPQLGGAQEQAGLVGALTKPRLSQKAKMDVAKFAQKERQIATKDRATAFKETKEVRKDILDSSKADQENLMRINRMSVLNQQGKLNNPLFYSTLKKVGLDIPALLTPESQEFQKLTIDFLKNAKKMFGARITNFEAETFLKSIPSLTQTPEGRDRVIHNLKMIYKGSDIRKKAMRSIIRENGGIPPLDLDLQIEERIDPELDKLSSEFKQGFSLTPQETSQQQTDQVEGGGLAAAEAVDQQPKPPTNVAQGIPQGESTAGAILRNVTRGAARAGESLIGLPGDIEAGVRFIGKGISKYDPAQYIIDGINDGAKKFLGIDLEKTNPANYLVDQLKKYIPSPGEGQILPTSDDVRKGVTERLLPKSYAEPQGGWESLADDFISDAVPLMIPIKGKIPFARALKAAGAGNLASTFVKKIGGGPKAQAASKVGTVLLTSMGNPFSFKNYVKKLYPTQAANFKKEVDGASKILNFIHKVKMPIGKGASVGLNPATAVTIGLLSGKVGPATAVMGALYGTGFTERLITMLAKNPNLRKHYVGLLKSAAVENAAMTAKNLANLDEEMKKEMNEIK